MDQYIFDESNGLWYERYGDYYLPCLALLEQKIVDKWGQKYRAYTSNNANQIVRRVNSGSGIYLNEINELTAKLTEVSRLFGNILERLSKIK